MATVTELHMGHDELIAALSMADIFYLITGAANEAAVRVAAAADTPATYNGMPRRHTRISERVNETTWKIRVHYESYIATPLADAFTFDTTGGSQHITQSILTRGAYAPPTKTAPDLQEAIGFDGKNVNGVDIDSPVFAFTETHQMDDADVDQAYKLAVFALTGRVNNAAFRGFAEGECLFRGAVGSQNNGGDWQITYKFASLPNVAGLTVGTITGISKFGWDYMWIAYAEAVDQSTVIKRPSAVYVEKVYHAGDFTTLEI